MAETDDWPAFLERFDVSNVEDRQTMTPEECLSFMREVAAFKGDPDEVHRQLDGAMLALLRHHGHNEIADLFVDTFRWYS